MSDGQHEGKPLGFTAQYGAIKAVANEVRAECLADPTEDELRELGLLFNSSDRPGLLDKFLAIRRKRMGVS